MKLIYLPFQDREMLEMSSLRNSFTYSSGAALLSRLQLASRITPLIYPMYLLIVFYVANIHLE